MGIYVARRLLQMVPMLLGIGTLMFVLLHLAPGGPVVALGGEFVTADYQLRIEALYGLDRPLPEQYLRYLGLLLQGELGQSYAFKMPVLDLLLARLGPTLLLIVPAIVISAIVGVWLGLAASRLRGGVRDAGLITCTFLCHAVPVFWVGQLLLMALAVGVGWFPTHGISDVRGNYTGWRQWLDVTHHLALPCLTLVLQQLAFTLVVTRNCVGREMHAPYFVTALAKGLSLKGAQYGHALPNAMLPVVTLIGNRVGWLIAGTVLVENVFAWPGLGRLVVTASLNRDYPLVMGVVLLVAAITMLANLVTDLIYVLIDPRVREGLLSDAR